MANFKYEQTGSGGILKITGKLTVNSGEDLKSALMMSLGSADYIVLDFDNVTDIDSGCLRILCGLIKTSKTFKKAVVLYGNNTLKLKKAIISAGHECPVDCNLRGNDCFLGWDQENKRSKSPGGLQNC